MRQTKRTTALVVGMTLLISSVGCGPGRTVPGTELRYPYAIPVACDAVAQQQGQVLRVTDDSGVVFIGSLLKVDCQNLPTMILDVHHSSPRDSIAVVPLAGVSSLEVLDTTKVSGDDLGDAIGIAALLAVSVTTTLIILGGDSELTIR